MLNVAAGCFFLIIFGLGFAAQVRKLIGKERYLAEFSEEAREYALSFPAWFDYAWLLAWGGGVAAALFLCFGVRASAALFTGAFMLLAIVTAYTYTFRRHALVMDRFHLCFSGGLLCVSAMSVIIAIHLTN